VALASIFVLVIFGRRERAATREVSVVVAIASIPDRVADPAMRGSVIRYAPKLAAWSVAAAIALIVGYFGSAYVSGNGPFRSDPYFGRGQVLRALPADFPAPRQARIEGAGAGSHLPYRVEWQSSGRTSDVAGLMRQQLSDGTWRIVDSSYADGATKLRSTRAAAGGLPPIVAEIVVTAAGAGSRVLLEFSPLPASIVPGYDAWLKSVGLVVHNVDPGTAAGPATPVP
jgi:hypothetical protein